MLVVNCRICARSHTIATDAHVRLCPLCQSNPAQARDQLRERRVTLNAKLVTAQHNLTAQLDHVSNETWHRYSRLSEARTAAAGNPQREAAFQRRYAQTIALGDDLAGLLRIEAVYNQLFALLHNQLDHLAETEHELAEPLSPKKRTQDKAA